MVFPAIFDGFLTPAGSWYYPWSSYRMVDFLWINSAIKESRAHNPCLRETPKNVLSS
jgi:hypothetical protein